MCIKNVLKCTLHLNFGLKSCIHLQEIFSSIAVPFIQNLGSEIEESTIFRVAGSRSRNASN